MALYGNNFFVMVLPVFILKLSLFGCKIIKQNMFLWQTSERRSRHLGQTIEGHQWAQDVIFILALISVSYNNSLNITNLKRAMTESLQINHVQHSETNTMKLSSPLLKKNRQTLCDQDDEFEPEYHTMKKLKLPINQKRLTKGIWTLKENQIYLAFLKDNLQHFDSENSRRQNRVFCLLSELLKKKRTPDQCRSHHQKMLKNMKFDIKALLAKLQKKYGEKQQDTSSCSKHQIKVEEPQDIGTPQLFQKKCFPQGINKNEMHQIKIPTPIKVKCEETVQLVHESPYRFYMCNNTLVFRVNVDTQAIRTY